MTTQKSMTVQNDMTAQKNMTVQNDMTTQKNMTADAAESRGATWK